MAIFKRWRSSLFKKFMRCEMFRIKFASKDDIKITKEIAEYYKIPFLCEINRCICMTATDEKPFGYICVEVNDNIAKIVGHAVLPNYRNKGYGTMLLKVILSNLYDFGIEKATIGFSDFDKFYIKNGFEKTNNGLTIDIDKLFNK